MRFYKKEKNEIESNYSFFVGKNRTVLNVMILPNKLSFEFGLNVAMTKESFIHIGIVFLGQTLFINIGDLNIYD